MPSKHLQLLLGLVCTSFLGLIAHAALAVAPPGHFKPADETVEDSGTKLVWQRTVPKDTYSAKEASRYCAELNLDDADWRLPSLKELHTLVDETRTDPAIDIEAFPDTPAEFFWSSSSVAEFPMYRWTVTFADGTDTWLPEDQKQRVRCVR